MEIFVPCVTTNKILSPATSGSAGIDLLFTGEYKKIEESRGYMYNTNMKVNIPEGYFGMLVMRSSAGKQGFKLKNNVGIIDSDYRGEIKAMIEHEDDKIIEDFSKPYVQLILVPYLKYTFVPVDSLDTTYRGEGGFGSTNPR